MTKQGRNYTAGIRALCFFFFPAERHSPGRPGGRSLPLSLVALASDRFHRLADSARTQLRPRSESPPGARVLEMKRRALAMLFVLAACGSPAVISGDEPGCVPGRGADGSDICTTADYPTCHDQGDGRGVLPCLHNYGGSGVLPEDE